jgi:hypothetical protein
MKKVDPWLGSAIYLQQKVNEIEGNDKKLMRGSQNGNPMDVLHERWHCNE